MDTFVFILFQFLAFQPDRSYKIDMISPPSTYFLKQAAGIQKAAMKGGIYFFIILKLITGFSSVSVIVGNLGISKQTLYSVHRVDCFYSAVKARVIL